MSKPRLSFRFIMKSVKDEVKSAEAGHPVFEDKEYIEILVPGDATSRVCRPVRPTDFEREDMPGARQVYEHFKRGIESPQSGVPLEQWPSVTAAQVDTLRVVGVRTVEQLASVSDQHIGTLGMGYHSLRQKAQDWLAAAKDNAHLEKMRAEMNGMKEQLEAAQRQLREAMDELRALKAPPGRSEDAAPRRQRT